MVLDVCGFDGGNVSLVKGGWYEPSMAIMSGELQWRKSVMMLLLVAVSVCDSRGCMR